MNVFLLLLLESGFLGRRLCCTATCGLAWASRVERQSSEQLFPTWESPPRVFNDTVLKTPPLQEQLLQQSFKAGPLLSGWQPDPGLSGTGEGGQGVVVIVKLNRCGPYFTQGPFHSFQERGPWSG